MHAFILERLCHSLCSQHTRSRESHASRPGTFSALNTQRPVSCSGTACRYYMISCLEEKKVNVVILFHYHFCIPFLVPLNTSVSTSCCNLKKQISPAKMSEALAPFSHQNALSRINDAGAFEGCGENLARLENYALDKVPEAAVDGWVHSPGHFRNMLLPEFNVCGIGIATYFRGGVATSGRSSDGRGTSSASAGGDQGMPDPDMPYQASLTGQCPQSQEPRESVTFVTMLFGIEREHPKTTAKEKILERTDATICACGVVGAALGGLMTGGMLGVAAGSFLHKAVGITPKGTAFCIKEFAKRTILGVGRLECAFCDGKKKAKYELDGTLFCADCWDEQPIHSSGERETFVVL
ncbi:unnamed protein product [Amoebophrya sp. A25]|nr:unnamed protein product [Amoebophrya sp. A25]|eukprot:GSA25T00001005001.1